MNKAEKQKRLSDRNEKIKADYFSMREEKYEGTRKYTEEYILKRLSEKYFLSPITIEQIIGGYNQRNHEKK